MAVEALPKNKLNRLDNLAHAHKVHLGRTWYENGVANPGTQAKEALRIGGVTEVRFSPRKK